MKSTRCLLIAGILAVFLLPLLVRAQDQWATENTNAASGGFAQTETLPPFPRNYFNDYVNAVKPETAQELNQRLTQFDRDTKNKIVVALYSQIPTGASIADYAQHIANSWGVGQKGLNNVVLLLVFVNNHEVQIEVGYGLEAVLPDALCKRIIEDDIAPRFHNGDYDGGLRVGIAEILAKVRTKALSTLADTTAEAKPAVEAQAEPLVDDAGRFVVSLPNPVHRSIQPFPIAGGTIAMHMVYYDDGAVAYMVAYCDYPADTVAQSGGPDKMYQKFASMNGTVRSYPCQLGDINGLEVVTDIPSKDPNVPANARVACCRFFFMGERLFQVRYIGPLGTETNSQAVAFLDSFRLTATADVVQPVETLPAPTAQETGPTNAELAKLVMTSPTRSPGDVICTNLETARAICPDGFLVQVISTGIKEEARFLSSTNPDDMFFSIESAFRGLFGPRSTASSIEREAQWFRDNVSVIAMVGPVPSKIGKYDASTIFVTYRNANGVVCQSLDTTALVGQRILAVTMSGTPPYVANSWGKYSAICASFIYPAK